MGIKTIFGTLLISLYILNDYFKVYSENSVICGAKQYFRRLFTWIAEDDVRGNSNSFIVVFLVRRIPRSSLVSFLLCFPLSYQTLSLLTD